MHPNPDTFDECTRLIEIIRQKTSDHYFLMKHGDLTHGIPDGEMMVPFCRRLKQEPQQLKDEMEGAVARILCETEHQKQVSGLDGFALCSDYCFNEAPFSIPKCPASLLPPIYAN